MREYEYADIKDLWEKKGKWGRWVYLTNNKGKDVRGFYALRVYALCTDTFKAKS